MFACFKSTYLRVKSKMFTFCRDNLFDSVMIIFSVEFVVLCFGVRCFFLRVCVVFAAFTCLKSAMGSVIILGFDLFHVTEVNLMSQTTARDNVERARDWSLKSLAAMILQTLSTFFSSILLLYFMQISCLKVAVPSTTPNHYNRLEYILKFNVIWRELKEKKKAYNTGYSQAVTHPSTNPARQGLTSVIGREPVLSLWYGRRQEKGAEILSFKPNVKIISKSFIFREAKHNVSQLFSCVTIVEFPLHVTLALTDRC